jgi:U3 small nucleolar ribonucleoprotein protein IMP4
MQKNKNLGLIVIFLFKLENISKKRKREVEIDNEYQKAGLQDPKILITTAHEPSDRLLRFMKELRFIFPNCQKMNRGQQTLKKIVDSCNNNGFTDLIIVHEHKVISFFKS